MKRKINNVVLASSMLFYPLANVPVHAEDSTEQQNTNTNSYKVENDAYTVEVTYDNALDSDPGLTSSQISDVTSTLNLLNASDPSLDFSATNTNVYQISTNQEVNQTAHVKITFTKDETFKNASLNDVKVYQITGDNVTSINNPTFAVTDESISFDATSLSTFAISIAPVKTFTVTFTDGQGNNLGDVQTVEYGKAASAPSNPTREGYTFKAWDTDYSSITSNLTVNATWNANSYQITYDLDGGTNAANNPSTYSTGDSITLSDPTKEGYTFVGWTSDDLKTPTKGVTISGTGNKTYKANWEINKYTVTFVDGFGNTLAEKTVDYGSSVTAPNDPTKEGYTFKGWDKNDLSKVTSDLTITAQWNINTYKVVFTDGQGNTISSEDVEYGKAAKVPQEPTRTGYSFTGWNKSFSKVTSDLTVDAQWKIKTYNVTFKDGFGSTIETQTVDYGQSAKEPSDPTKDGYKFMGWDADYSKVTSNLTVNAKWEKVEVPKKDDTNKKTTDNKNNTNTNKKEEVKYGNLTISNTVSGEGSDTNQEFTYQIYFTKNDKVVSDSFAYSGSIQGSLTNGSKFTLKNGQSITIENIPVGINYSIVELEANGDYKTTVTGNASGTVVEGATSISFVNEKTTFLKIKGVLRAKVTLDSKEASGSDYHFQLKDANGNVIQVKTNNNGDIEFDPIQFTEEGTYVYYISQIEGTDKKISYDDSVYKETITISKKDGKYVASTSYQKDGKDYNGTPVFNNRSKQAVTFGARTSTETHTGLYVGVAAVAIALIGFLGFKAKKK